MSGRSVLIAKEHNATRLRKNLKGESQAPAER